MTFALALSCAVWAAMARAAQTTDRLAIMRDACFGAALLFAASMWGLL